METPIQAEPKKSNTGLIIGIVVVVVLCCCCVALIGGLAIAGPTIGKTFSSVNKDLKPGISDFPTLSPDDFPTISPDATMPSLSDIVPNGGKGDDSQRASAWAYVIVATATDGCSYNPKASATTIKVTQEADSSGVWAEEWTVTCDDGTKKPYTVTFTPGASGTTEIKVK